MKSKLSGLIKFAVILLPIIGILLAVTLVKTATKLFTSAGVGVVNFDLFPTDINLPPNQTFKIFLDPKNEKVVFSRIVVSFDNSKVRLESVNVSSIFSNVVYQSSIAESNTSGRITLVVAVQPGEKVLNEIVEVANFTLSTLTNTVDDSTTLSFVTSDMQVVKETGETLNIQTTSANLSLNLTQPTPTPTPTPTPVSTTCPSGYGDCDGNPDNGCETSLNTNSNCGGCGWACTRNEACRRGQCIDKYL